MTTEVNRTDAYEAISELISDKFTNAVEEVLKGIVDIAKGEPTSLELNLPESDVQQVANEFLSQLGAVDASLVLLPTGRKAPLEKVVSPYILLPSGRSSDGSDKEILAPSLSLQIKTKW